MIDEMTESLFADKPFDAEPGLRPATQHTKKAWAWLKEHASLIGLAIAVMI